MLSRDSDIFGPCTYCSGHSTKNRRLFCLLLCWFAHQVKPSKTSDDIKQMAFEETTGSVAPQFLEVALDIIIPSPRKLKSNAADFKVDQFDCPEGPGASKFPLIGLTLSLRSTHHGRIWDLWMGTSLKPFPEKTSLMAIQTATRHGCLVPCIGILKYNLFDD